MSSNGGKLSFAFAPPSSSSSAKPPTSTGPSSAPKSNLELLMAKSKVPSKPSNSFQKSSKPSLPFGEEDDNDDDEGGTFNALAGPSTSKTKSKLQAPVGQTNLLSRSERKAQKVAESIDQSIFDYDTHYDQMKVAEKKREEEKKKEGEERKPKYIESFLASAQTRKLDKLRAEEKSLQREREKEGNEFEEQDKEKFVTENYKRQMEEVRKAEEEEKQREEELRKTRSGPGLTAFYKSMLESSEIENAAAVAATSGPSSVAGQGPSLAIRPPTNNGGPSRQDDFDDTEEYDPLLAREAKAASAAKAEEKAGSSRIDSNTDKLVEVNDEGEIIDKRSLLKAGLNITKKPKPSIPNSLLTSQRSGEVSEGPYKSRAVGSAASYQERMERERRRLSEQLQEQERRKRLEAEENRRKEEEEARKRKEGDNGEAERKRTEAKERFLARKRQRELDEKEKNEREKKAKEE